jgi:hypothetical protein
MPEEYSIDVVINEEGEIESTVNGVMGPSCEELTSWLENLGDTVEHYHTPDYNRQQGRSQARMVRR